MLHDCPAGDIGQLKEAECRLVVVGRSGSGKSSVVNALLGSDLCAVSHYAQSMTTEAKMFTRARFGKEIMVSPTACGERSAAVCVCVRARARA